jgi:VCBS repeat-containing protein
VNGVAIRSGTLSAAPENVSRSSNFVGRSNWSSDAYFRGSIRDLKLYNTARSANEIGNDRTTAAVPSDSTLVAWYPLGTATPSTILTTSLVDQEPLGGAGGSAQWTVSEAPATATDASGVAGQAALVRQNGANYAVTYNAPGQNGALVLDGVNDYARLPALTLGGDLTMEAWVYADGTPGAFSRIIDLGNGQASNNLILGFDAGGQLFFQAYNGFVSSERITVNGRFSGNRWQHVAATVDAANNVTLYLNGTVVSTGKLNTSPASISRTNNFLGRSNWSADPYFHGGLRDLRIYDKARTQAEINSDMAGLVPDGANAGLLAWYSLDGRGFASGRRQLSLPYQRSLRFSNGQVIGLEASATSALLQRSPDWTTNGALEASEATGPAQGSHRGQQALLMGGAGVANRQTFSSGAPGWTAASSAAITSTLPGAYGSVLGPFANGTKQAGQDVWTNLSLTGNGAQIGFTLHRLDSWDGEVFRVYGNNQVLMEQAFNHGIPLGGILAGGSGGYRWTLSPRPRIGTDTSPNWNEQSFDAVLTVPAGVTSLQLGFGSTLDQATDDESWAVDDLAVVEAGMAPGLLAPSGSGSLNYQSSTALLTDRSVIAITPRVVSQVPGTAAGSQSYLIVDGIRNADVARDLGRTMQISDANGNLYQGFSLLARLTSMAEVEAVSTAWSALGLTDGALVDGRQSESDTTWRFNDGTPLSAVWGSTTQHGLTAAGSFSQVQNLAFGRDAALVKIDTASENETVRALLSANGVDSAWIGAERTALSQPFRWVVDNSSTSYTNWRANQPDNNNSSTLAEPNVQLFASDGRWNDFSGSNQLPGVWEAVVPNLPWANGEPNDGFGTTRNSQNVLQIYSDDSVDDVSLDGRPYAVLQVTPLVGAARDILELFTDYRYNWTSNPLELRDRRQNLRFSVTSAAEAITQQQPVVHQIDVPGLSTSHRLVARQVNQPVYVTQAVTTGITVGFNSDLRRSDAVPFSSLAGETIRIQAGDDQGGDADLRGHIDARSSLEISAGGQLRMTGGRLRGDHISLQASGTALGADVLVTAGGNDPIANLSIQARGADGSGGTLALEATITPSESLELTAGQLQTATGGASLQARHLDLHIDDDIDLAVGQGAPGLLWTVSSDADGSHLGSTVSALDGGSPLQLQRLGAGDPLVITTSGALELSGTLRPRDLELRAGAFLPAAGTTLEASGRLQLIDLGSTPLDLGSLTLAAPELRLQLLNGGVVMVDSPMVELDAAGPSISLSNSHNGTSHIGGRLSAAASSLSTAADLVVTSLDMAQGAVAVTAASGDLELGRIRQGQGGSLTLLAPGGDVRDRGGSDPSERSLRRLVVNSRDGLHLSTDELHHLSAVATAPGSSVRVQVSQGGELVADTLVAATGVQVHSGLAALRISQPAAIQAGAVDLGSFSRLTLDSGPAAATLQASQSLRLAAPVMTYEPQTLTLRTTNAGGAIELWLADGAAADDLRLPLLRSDHLTLVGEAGLRLTPGSFQPEQSQAPLQSISFAVPDTSSSLTPQRFPGSSDRQALVDADGILYVREGDGRLRTHYDEALKLYRFTGLSRSEAGSTLSVIELTSPKPELPSERPEALDPATLRPQLREAKPVAVTPVLVNGQARASATSGVGAGNGNRVQIGQQNLAAPTGTTLLLADDLLEQLVQSGYLVQSGQATSSPLEGAAVWLDLNGNLQPDADEPATVAFDDGRFQLAISPQQLAAADHNGNGSLNDEGYALVSRGGVDSLTRRPVPNLLLIGQLGRPVLTPVTTLVQVLRRVGADDNTIERLSTTLVGSGWSLAETFERDPYEELRAGDVEALAEVIGHARLAALLQLSLVLGERDGLSAAVSLDRMGGVLQGLAQTPGADLELGAVVSALVLALDPVGRLGATAAANLTEVALKVDRELAAIATYATRFVDATAALAPADVLAAVNRLKALIFDTYTRGVEELFNGTITGEALVERFERDLASGGFSTTQLNGQRLVSIRPLDLATARSGAITGNPLVFVVGLNRAAPSQGVRLLVQVSGGGMADRVEQLVVPAGATTALLTVETADLAAEAVERLSAQLLWVDDGNAIDPAAVASSVRLLPTKVPVELPPLVLVSGTSGDDRIDRSSRSDRLTLDGDLGNDSLVAGAGADSLSGGPGQDYLVGGSGSDELVGGSGNDSLVGQAGDDDLEGGSGDDDLEGGQGHDRLKGEAGNDQLRGESGDDELSGGAGNDVLMGGTGQNVLMGGAGADRLLIQPRAVGERQRDLLLDVDHAAGDRLVVVRSHFQQVYGMEPVLADFAIIGGSLLYRGQPLAQLFNGSRSYGFVHDLSQILEIVDGMVTPIDSSELPGPQREAVQGLQAGPNTIRASEGLERLLLRSEAPSGERPRLTLAGEAPALVLQGSIDLDAGRGTDGRLIHADGGLNRISTGAGNDLVALYGIGDQAELGAGDDHVHLLPGSGGATVTLGAGFDRVLVYGDGFSRRPETTLTDFDPLQDRIQMETPGQVGLRLDRENAALQIDGVDVLHLRGNFSEAALRNALILLTDGEGDGLAPIRQRGLLTVAMLPNLPGSSVRDGDGRWSGYNVDLARAVADALLGSPDRLAILPGESLVGGLAAVADGHIDLAAVGATANLSRDIQLGIDFSSPFLVDTQSLLVPDGITLMDLDQGVIGVIQGSTAIPNVQAFLRTQGLKASLRVYSGPAALLEGFRAGEVSALSSDRTRLESYRRQLNSGARLLEVNFAEQPLAFALADNNSDLRDAVSWVVQVPALADQLGLSARDLPLVLSRAASSEQERQALDPAVRALLDLPADPEQVTLGDSLGIDRRFGRQTLARTGNLEELWQRHYPELVRHGGGREEPENWLISQPLGAETVLATPGAPRVDNRLNAIVERDTLVVAADGAGGVPLPGVDADLAHVLATALLGDAEAVRFETDGSFTSSFEAVAEGNVDLVIRGTTATLGRDGALGVDFSAPYQLTHLRVLTHRDSGIVSFADLNGVRVGLVANTTGVEGFERSLERRNIWSDRRTYATVADLQDALLAGEVEAIATDASQLEAFANQQALSGRPTRFLPESLSDEPIAVVLAENQSDLRVRVNAVIQILRTAAQLEVTAANAAQRAEQARNPEADLALRELFGTAPGSGLATIGLDVDRVRAVIETRGNLAEILARHGLDTEASGQSLARLVDSPFGAATPPPTPPANQPAVIGDPDAAVVTEDALVTEGALVASGLLTLRDADGPQQEGFRLTVIKVGDPWGTLRLDGAGRYHYQVANDDPRLQALRQGQSHRDRFTVTAWDGTSHTLEFTVLGAADLRQVRVIDGYLAGATVFADLDGDGRLDLDQEPWALSDAQGLAQLDSGDANVPMVSVGGTDTATGVGFEGSLRTLPGATVISPLTTVVAELVIGQGIANGEELLRQALGLPEVDLGSFDPFAPGVDPQLALRVQRAAAQVAMVLQLGQRAGFNPQALVAAIAIRVGDSAAQSLNLADPATLHQVLATADPLQPAASLEAMVSLISRSNGLIADASRLEDIASAQVQSLRGDPPSDPSEHAPEPNPPAADMPKAAEPDHHWRRLYQHLVNRLVDRRTPKSSRRRIRQMLLFLIWSRE